MEFWGVLQIHKSEVHMKKQNTIYFWKKIQHQTLVNPPVALVAGQTQSIDMKVVFFFAALTSY